MLPALLFRVHSKESPGLNSPQRFASPANAAWEDVSRLQHHEHRTMLVEHVTRLKQYCGMESTIPDDYISFTPTLVWAMQYAHFKYWKDTDTTVYITVLKTKDFPSDTFQHTSSLLREYQLPERGPMEKRPLLVDAYNESEWLARGRLFIKNRSSTVPLQEIVYWGLYDLYPEFSDPRYRHQVHKRVVQLRNMWQETANPNVPAGYPMHATPYACTANDIKTANEMASLFLPEYQTLMTLWFLAMKSRISDILSIGEDGQQILQETIPCSPFPSLWPDSLSDLRQFEALAQLMQQETKLRVATTKTSADLVNDDPLPHDNPPSDHESRARSDSQGDSKLPEHDGSQDMRDTRERGLEQRDIVDINELTSGLDRVEIS